MASLQQKLDYVSSAGWDKHRLIELLMAYTDNPSAINYSKMVDKMSAYQADHNETLAVLESLQSIEVL